MKVFREKNGFTAIETQNGITYRVHAPTQPEAVVKLKERLNDPTPAESRICPFCAKPIEHPDPYKRCCC